MFLLKAGRTTYFLAALLLGLAAGEPLWAHRQFQPPTSELLAHCEWILESAHSVHSPTDLKLDKWNPTSRILSKSIGVSHLELAPPATFMPSPKGLVLGINGVTKLETYYKTSDYLSGHSFQVEGYVHQTRARSIEDMLRKFVDQYNHYGPIHKLVIAAHGESGAFYIGGEKLDLEWIEKHKELVESLPEGLFTEDAEVILVSCSTAEGDILWRKWGQNQLRDIFRPLLKNGGTITAATRYVDPELAYIPRAYKSNLDRAVRHLIVSPIVMVLDCTFAVAGDADTRNCKVVRIDVPAMKVTNF